MRKLKQKSIEQIIKLLHFLLVFFNKYKSKKISVENEFGFEDLTPTLIQNSSYSKALNWALNNDKINNIALTGVYGSGKSSVLFTFKENNKNFQYLNISLATFSIKKDDKELLKEINLVEQSILQQLFYHVKESQIPDSRFKRIKSLNKTNLFILTCCFLLWGLSTLILFYPLAICLVSNLSFLYDNYFDAVRFISFLIFVIGLFYLLYKSARIVLKSKINKVNIKDGEFEINSELDSSILNKHLDEILYFFEKTPYNVVIIEDLDRFEVPEIFTRLRELNNLINNSLQINKHVTFIYAVKDDMFDKEENRTKFFDFIIPVIPVINSSNSFEKLSEKFDSISNIKIDKEFLREITLYINDMRMLKNIFNEFMLYKAQLCNLDLNIDKLFSIIVYKNLYSADFSLLHKNEGMVFKIFNSKSTYIAELISKIDEQIKVEEAKIQDLTKIQTENISELRPYYVGLFLSKLPDNAKAIKFKNGTVTFLNKLTTEENFNILIEEPTINYVHDDYNTVAQIKTSMADVLDEQGRNFKDRSKLIQNDKKKEIEKIKVKIQNHANSKSKIKSANFKEITALNKGTSFLNEEPIYKEKLLLFLLRNGYIDEMYHSYITFFYEGSLTSSDMDFVFSVKNEVALDFDFELINYDEIIKNIKIQEFEKIEILNFRLMDFLLSSKKHVKHLDQLFTLFVSENEIAMRFFNEYIERNRNVKAFIKKVCSQWKLVWNHFMFSDEYSDEKRKSLLFLILINVDNKTIVSLNQEGFLNDYLSHTVDYLSIFQDNEEKGIDLIQKLDIVFSKLDSVSIPKPIFDFIYESRRYKLNYEVLLSIAKLKGEEKINVEEIESQNFSVFFNNAFLEDCLSYIMDNFEDYLDNVYLKLNPQTDDEDVLIGLMNNYALKIELVDKYLSHNLTIISDIETIKNKDFWVHLLEISVIEANWKNVIKYFEYSKNILDDNLLAFLNTEVNYRKLSKFKVDFKEVGNEDLVRTFISSMILSEKINFDAFGFLIISIPYKYSKIAFNSISKDKVQLLIDNNILTLSKDNYDLLKSDFPNLHLDLIYESTSKFIDNLSDYVYDDTELLALLNSGKFSNSQLQKLILKSTESDINNNIKLADKITSIIIESAFPLDTFTNDYKITLLQKGTNQSSKLKLLNNLLKNNSFSETQILDFVNSLGGLYLELLKKGPTPKFSLNPDTKFFAEKLYENGIISSYKEKSNKIQINTKRK